MVGIVGYGTYIPKYRIKVSEVAKVWGKDPDDIKSTLGVFEKSVPAIDEDAVTLAVEAARNALKHAKILPNQIEQVLFGSESYPYAVNPSSTIVAEALGVGNNYLAADLEFACKAATAGLQLTFGTLAAKRLNHALVIGSDVACAKPHDALEYTVGAGAAAFILGRDDEALITKVLDFSSFSSDTPDFWRRDGIKYPSHNGRFTGEPAYFYHVIGAAQRLLKKINLQPSDFDYAIFHMPNYKFPTKVAKRLGFTFEQIKASLLVSEIGNTYSASSLLGLCRVLDQAKPKMKIFLVSYGSGAGADSFVLETTDRLIEKRNKSLFVNNFLKQKTYINYIDYLKQTRHKLG